MAQGGLQREFMCKDLARQELLARVERDRLLVEHLPAEFTRRHPIASLRRAAGELRRAAGAWRAKLGAATVGSTSTRAEPTTPSGNVG